MAIKKVKFLYKVKNYEYENPTENYAKSFI